MLAAAALLPAFSARAAAAPAWPRYGERERLACSACHIRDDGGPLTAFGRDYRWRVSPQDAADAEAHANLRDTERDETDASARSAPRAGRWSGEATMWARSGGSRVLGERTRSFGLFESLRLDGDALLGDERLSFTGEGFARQGFAETTGGLDDDAASLATAAITLRDATGAAYARLGRQFVASGAVVRRVDGLALHSPLGDSFEADVFGGLPVDNGFGGVAGDFITGGRFGTRIGSDFRAGISGFYAKDDADPSDGKGGVDLDWQPLRSFDVAGHLFYDWIADRIYDARIHALWMPSIEWQLAADWSHAVPGLFLPANSLFSVFSVDAYDESGLTLTRRFDENLSTRGFVRYTAYDHGGALTHFGGGIDGRYGPNGEDLVGAELAYQDESRDELGGGTVDGDVLFVRGYHLLWWTAEIYTSVDASVQFAASNGSDRDAILARALAGYDPHARWDVECGVDWVRDPEFEDRLDVFARLRLRF